MPFQCDDIKIRWSEYFYRELDEHEQADFVRHLQQCEACRKEEREWKAILSRFDVLAASDGTSQAPTELVYRVKRQVQLFEQWTQETKAIYRHRFSAAAATILITLLGGWSAITVAHQFPKPQMVYEQMSETVLQSIYTPATIDLYRENGMLIVPYPDPARLTWNESEPARSGTEPNKREKT